jgi:subtilisin family serine protease
MHADEGRCYTHAAKAGVITDGQRTYLQVVKTVAAGDLLFNLWVSSQSGSDGVTLSINGIPFWMFSGLPEIFSGVTYPAKYPESIAVGASSNFDCRADYSQFGPEVAFVAPSNGGTLGIETTDRSGAAGYDSGNYTLAAGLSGFGGTSSATPLASGIAGLILSRNPALTRTQVLQIMQNSADKVGPEPYVAGRNDRYGYGRLNAYQGLVGSGSEKKRRGQITSQ